MAQFKNVYKVELNQGTAPVVPLRQIYYGDVEANRIGAIVLLNGEEVTLTGTCSGTAILADGSTVAITGAIDGSQAYVELPAACYSKEGSIQVFVKLTVSGVTTTLLAAVGTVRLTETDTVIDPGTIIPSVAALIEDIDEAVASIPADYSDLLAAIAPAFSSSTAYTAGRYVWYSGTLYRFTADHAAGAWTGSDAAAAVIGADLASLKSAVTEETESAKFTQTISGETLAGVTLTALTDNTMQIYGVPTATRQLLLLNGQDAATASTTAFSKTLDAGTYNIAFGITGSNYINIRYTETTFANFTRLYPGTITFAHDVMIGLYVKSDQNYGTSDSPSVITFSAKKITAIDPTARQTAAETKANIPNRLSLKQTDADTIADGTDYDSLTTPGNYKCTTSGHAATMSHAPSGNAHRLSVYSTTDNNNFLQIAYVNYSKGTLLKFRSKTNTTGWTDWKTLADRDWVGNKITTDEIPDYYFDDDYLPDRIDTIISNNASIGMNNDSFIFFTDPHTWRDGDVTAPQNGLQQVKLIRYIIDHTNINHVVCGGDMTNGDYMTQTQELELLKATRTFFDPIWDKMHMVIGNHEWNKPGSDSPEANLLTMNQIYPLLLKDKEKDYGSFDETSGSYWVDNTFQKIRYFFLGCNNGGNIDRAEAAWFATQLGQVPSGYTVFVISHIGLSVSNSAPYETIYMGRFSDIAGLLDAAKAHTTFTGTQYSNPITADYTNLNVTVAGVISGHKHRDLEMYTTGGIPIIGVTRDKGVVSGDTNLFKTVRALGTIGEQAIDVVQIDVTNRKIYVTRIGGCLTGASYDSETGKVYDTEAGTGTEYDGTEWTIYSPYKDREYTF